MEAKNDMQKEILDRLNGGEGVIQYHPQSLLGGEVIDMVERGLIEAHTNKQGFCYITLPGEGPEEEEEGDDE